MKPFIRPAKEADLTELVRTMCESDREELRLLGVTPLQALREIEIDNTLTVELAGRVVALFGVVPINQTLGRVWMLSTDQTHRCKSLARAGRQFVKEQARKHQFLTNIAWSKNTAHLNWIDWLGFHFLSIEEHNGEKFVRFGLMGSKP